MPKEISSFSFHHNREVFKKGIHDGIPIALGYFAVSFSLGIAAHNAGLTALQSFFASLLCNASAGEYAGFTVIAAGASYLEMAMITLIANARYLLMSCALSQRIQKNMPFYHRFLMAFDLTDELFGIAIARQGTANPYYSYGAMLVALPGWSLGSLLGAIAGNLLPLRIVSALSVALYGMFLAIIIPPAKKDRVILVLILLSFVLSGCASYLPGISLISSGTRTILLTVGISAVAALLFPKKMEEFS